MAQFASCPLSPCCWFPLECNANESPPETNYQKGLTRQIWSHPFEFFIRHGCRRLISIPAFTRHACSDLKHEAGSRMLTYNGLAAKNIVQVSSDALSSQWSDFDACKTASNMCSRITPCNRISTWFTAIQVTLNTQRVKTKQNPFLQLAIQPDSTVTCSREALQDTSDPPGTSWY